MRSLKDWTLLVAKGFAMGTADIIPGVSGGTIAFITGIYEELISSIAGLGLSTARDLFKNGIKSTWAKYNLNFLVAVFTGILVAVFTLSKALNYLYEFHPEELLSFFFGLVLASTPIIWRTIKVKNLKAILFLFLGSAIAALITSSPTLVSEPTPLLIAISGAIAISAMLLPGLSGSFLLIILGAHKTILTAVEKFDIVILGSFLIGIIIGLLSFSRLLKNLLKNHHDLTISTLVGFMLGAIHELWPWKESDISEAASSEILFASVFAIIGAAIVFILGKLSKK